jgi:hypothetical protein
MSIEAILAEAKKFSRSSAYKSGDRTSFSVRLHESITLHGKCSPSDYLDKLGLTTVPAQVMIICPGNGGLIAECFERGAKHVIAMEPRPRFQSGLQGVMRLLGDFWRVENKQGLNCQRIPAWPLPGKDRGFKNVPLVLWPEGMDEITRPKVIFQGLADVLAPGGKLVVELALGKHGWVDKINSWRPSAQALAEMSKEFFDGPWEGVIAGRSDTRRIYSFVMPGKTEPAPVKKAAKKKKKKAAKKAAPAPAPEPKPEPAPEPKAAPEAPRELHLDLDAPKAEAAPKPAKKKTKKKRKKAKKKAKPAPKPDAPEAPAAPEE